MIKVAVIGAKGYVGEELIKLLIKHPKARITVLADKINGATTIISETYPYLKGVLDLQCEEVDYQKISDNADIIFLALPHTVSIQLVPKFASLGKKIIDLSADYRLKDPEVYEKWYESKHSSPELLKKAVYGLPELYRKKIKKAKLIANPGCYPTSIILGCYPALKHKIIKKKGVIIDSKSGISGGGREFVKSYKSPNTYAYKIGGLHRHISEIEQELKCLITFTPHIVPQERGMLSTIYMKLKKIVSSSEVAQVYRDFYAGEPFVRIVEAAMTKNVVNTNFCDIALNVDKRTENLIVTSAIDNLVKGASGQAVQNMNIMFGLDEKEGLA